MTTIFISLLFFIVISFWVLWMFRFPGKNFRGALIPLSLDEVLLKERLSHHAQVLAEKIGGRNAFYEKALEDSADYIENILKEMGYQVTRQSYEVEGQVFENLEVDIMGSRHPDEIEIVGAHYDSVEGSPGADDNASGVAAVLELARIFKDKRPLRTLRFLFFVNEEPPYFLSDHMGSLVYARECLRRGDQIKAMMSIESIGYYSEKKGSQTYPFPFRLFYPTHGDFIGFVSNFRSGKLLRTSIQTFRKYVSLPSEGAILPEWVAGVGWSDHWSFWEVGYPAIMITDTALFRNPHYHTENDVPDTLDYERMTRVVLGLEKVIDEWTS